MDKQAGAVEWFQFDFEYAYTPVRMATWIRTAAIDFE